MTNLLIKDVPFVFNDTCLSAFNMLKKALGSAPIITLPNWSLPFKIMCNASYYAIGAFLGQKKDNCLHMIYYASHILTEAQFNYTITEKEMLAVVLL